MFSTKIKNNHKPWKDIMNDYFLIMDYHLDFQIEWQKISSHQKYAEWYSSATAVSKKWSP